MPLWLVSAEGPRALIDQAATAAEECENPPLSISMFEAGKTVWSLDLLYAEEVDLPALKRTFEGFDTSLAALELHQGPLPEENWVAKSLKGLKPIEAGRFFVHGSHDARLVPPGKIPIVIEAGEAFGTGHHGTTEGCLDALSRIDRDYRPERVLDLGTGSGILAIAAAKLWHGSVLATDIDPIAVNVAHENARLNGVQSNIRFAVAGGTSHPDVHAGAPYDSIIANILALPLRQLAGDISAALAPGGALILSGILKEQALRVEAVYAGHHTPSQARLTYGEWMTLICRKA
jgi:ribosomal protein L11 methyltransferase